MPLSIALIFAMLGSTIETSKYWLLFCKLLLVGIISIDIIYYDFEHYPFFDRSMERLRVFPNFLEKIGSKISDHMDLTSTVHLSIYMTISIFLDISVLNKLYANPTPDIGFNAVSSIIITILLLVLTLINSGYK